MRLLAIMHARGNKPGAYLAFRRNGSVVVRWVEHGDDRDGAVRVEVSPFARDEGVLHGSPIQAVGCDLAASCRRMVVAGANVDGTEKVGESLEIYPHLKNKLAEGHLLRCSESIEVQAIGSGIENGLQG